MACSLGDTNATQALKLGDATRVAAADKLSVTLFATAAGIDATVAAFSKPSPAGGRGVQSHDRRRHSPAYDPFV
jgi:hypothetical protein